VLFALNDQKLIRQYEEKYYATLDAVEKIALINIFKSYINLDYRREMLCFFSYREPYSQYNTPCKKYFLLNPLSFEEAVIVSEFLKTKKTEVKKFIVEHFQKMSGSEKVMLKAYLAEAREDYKNEAANDLTGLEEQKKVPAESVDQTAKASAVKFPKVSVRDMAENKLIDCFTKLKEFVEENKDYQYLSARVEVDLFGASYFNLKDSVVYPLQKESDAVIAGLCLPSDELAYFVYALLHMHVVYGYIYDTTNLGRKFDEIANVKENRRLGLSYFIPMLLHYIKENNSSEIQKAFVHLMLFVLQDVRLPENAESDNSWSYSDEDKVPAPMWRRLIDLASQLNDMIKFDLLDRETLTVYSEALNYTNNTPRAPFIFENSQEIYSHIHDKGIIDKSELFEMIKMGVFDIPKILREPSEFCNEHDKERYLYSGKHSKEYIDLVERAIMFMLDVEIERNQAETIYTNMIIRCSKLFGIKYYLNALQAFQKMTMPRGSSFCWSTTKDNTFANIVQSVIPYKDDTYEEFSRLSKELKLSDKDLVKGVLFSNNSKILEVSCIINCRF
jgi:hypothetical protein